MNGSLSRAYALTAGDFTAVTLLSLSPVYKSGSVSADRFDEDDSLVYKIPSVSLSWLCSMAYELPAVLTHPGEVRYEVVLSCAPAERPGARQPAHRSGESG